MINLLFIVCGSKLFISTILLAISVICDSVTASFQRQGEILSFSSHTLDNRSTVVLMRFDVLEIWAQIKV